MHQNVLNIKFSLLQKKKSSFLKTGGKLLGSLMGDKTAVFG